MGERMAMGLFSGMGKEGWVIVVVAWSNKALRQKKKVNNKLYY
jgi:hypothetical protein